MAARADVAVLGAGIVGVSVALHLVRRGRSVVLIDRGAAGGETSFGNAGLIQREGVAPYAFPQSALRLLAYARNRSLDMRFHWRALPGLAPALVRYWAHSRPKRYDAIVGDYARLIAHAVTEHAPLVADAGAESLIVRGGWIEAFRSPRSLAAAADAATALAGHGLDWRAMDGGALAVAQPGIAPVFAGALHWTQPWSVRDPFALTQAYLRLFERLGGRFVTGDAATLRSDGDGWEVLTQTGPLHMRDAVICLGPWSQALLARLGRRLPLFIKRGYHAHYHPHPERPAPTLPVYDEAGYVLAPMAAGLRLTTGAEFAGLDAPPDPVQVDAAEGVARGAFGLGARLPGPIWKGARPCTPDMKPIIGPEGRRGLWVATGHAHHGLTLGPVTGRLLAEMMTGAETVVDPAPYRIGRF